MTILGIDVGGTKIAAGLVTFPEGIVSHPRTIPTLPERGGAAVMEDVERLASALIAEASSSGLRVDAIGAGVCELVDGPGCVTSAQTLDWRGATLHERLSCIAPTVIEADVRAAALAEALFGAGQNARVFLYISIGTGISSCLVIDSQPFRGARGGAGTMASAPLPGFSATGSDAPSLTLEEFAAGPGLVSRFNQLGSAARSGEDVLTAAAAGDAHAAQVVRSAASALGGSIGWLVNVLDPELVVLGGGLGLSDGLYRDTLTASARRHIWWDGHRDLPIVPAATGANAGLIGAAAAAWRHFGHPPSP